MHVTSNTLVLWPPKHWHGTSLSAKGPESRSVDYRQSGVSIVTSSQFPAIRKKYMANAITAIKDKAKLVQEDMKSGKKC